MGIELYRTLAEDPTVSADTDKVKAYIAGEYLLKF